MNSVRSDYIKLLLAFSALPRTMPNPTVFEVAGFPHYENVISNILAFYLDPQREHGMGSLLLDSILTLAVKNAVERTAKIEIPRREFQTICGGRLDLIVKTSNYVIGIENKIYHEVNNDLLDYWATIAKEAQGRHPIGIVLSLRKTLLPDNCEFRNITYAQLWREVKSQLGHRIQKSDTKWLQYLFDLMDTTKSLEGVGVDLTKEDEFFIEHNAVITQLVEERDKFLRKLQSRVDMLRGMIEKSALMPFEKQWIFQGTCLVHDFSIDGHSITFDLLISPTGWLLQIFERKSKIQEYLEPRLKGRDYEVVIDEKVYLEKRFNIKKWRLEEASLEDIRNYLCEWMQWLTKNTKVFAAI